MSPQPFDSFKGFAVTFRQMFKKPITQQYPDYKRPVYPRFRGRHRLWKHENGLEKCVGCSLCAAACPADCIRVVADENTPDNRVSRRRALRAHLRDQPLALHLLRLLRARLPVRRDHARGRVRALRVLARRPHLHEGHAPRRAREADAGRRPRPLRHARAGLEGGVVTELVLAASAANILVWIVWILAALALLASRARRRALREPVLQRARADREPRLARGPLPAALGASSSPPRRCSSTRARSWSCSSSSSPTSAGARTRPGPAARRSSPSPRSSPRPRSRSRSSSSSPSRPATALSDTADVDGRLRLAGRDRRRSSSPTTCSRSR